MSSWYVFGGGMEIERNGKVEVIERHEIFYTEYTQKVGTLLSAIALMFYFNMDFICTGKPV